MKIRIHWDYETGRVSANCQNHSVTLIRQTRSHLEDLVESDEDILNLITERKEFIQSLKNHWNRRYA
jgi:hypothetical protein